MDSPFVEGSLVGGLSTRCTVDTREESVRTLEWEMILDPLDSWQESGPDSLWLLRQRTARVLSPFAYLSQGRQDTAGSIHDARIMHFAS